jgi:hypothetical protein
LTNRPECGIIIPEGTRKEKIKMFYGYYEKCNMMSEEKFNDFAEVEEWAVNTFGCYDTDYLFAVEESEVEDF